MTIPPPCLLPFHLLRPPVTHFHILFLGETGGAAAAPPQNLPVAGERFAVRIKRTKAGGRVVKSRSAFSTGRFTCMNQKQWYNCLKTSIWQMGELIYAVNHPSKAVSGFFLADYTAVS